MLLYDVHVLLPLLCRQLIEFLQLLYKVYSDLYFTYLEINPLGTCKFIIVVCKIFRGWELAQGFPIKKV